MSRYKKIELTPRKLDEIKREIAGQTMILTLAYLMDDQDFDADRLVELWDGLSRYADAVNTHIISLKKICEIIKQHTGLEIRWNN